MKIEGRRYLSFSELMVEASWKGRLPETELGTLLSIVPFQEQGELGGSFRIQLGFEIAPLPFESPPGGFKTNQGYGLSIFHGDEHTIITDGDSAFTVDHQRGKGLISFHQSFSSKTALAKSNFFLGGLIHLFAHYGYYDLHGAGLTNNGNGCLFLGPSGSGKSSLALNLVSQGWCYASDDALLMDTHKCHVSVLSFRKKIYVDPLLARRFPELEHEIKKYGQTNDKCFIELENVWPNRFHAQFIPNKIIFCSVNGWKTSRIQPISKKDAVLYLLPQSASVFFNQAAANKQMKALNRLVKQTVCYRLDAGLDIYNDAEKAADILSRVC